jgi:inhibitor of cysteine peptidase
MRPNRLATLLIAGVLTGCSSSPPAAPSVIITEAQNGGTVQMRAVQSLIVRLPRNPSTGYNWSVSAGSTPLLQLANTDYEPGPSIKTPAGDEPPAVGRPGTEIMAFAPQRAGSGRLLLAYRRPWEPAATPARTFTAQVVVGP